MNALRVLPRPVTAQGVRVMPWRLDPGLAHLAMVHRRRLPLSPRQLAACLDGLRALGYRGAVTAALGLPDQEVFHANGFRVLERLHLLRHDLRQSPRLPGSGPTRRARRRDHDAILAVDAAAFVPFWQLDETLLAEAIAATRVARLRVVDGPRGVVGYAVCGRSGSRGYVQRLAVHPDHQGQGLGAALLADGLAWLSRWGARDVLVNTQTDNRRSLSLYQRAGFELEPTGLAVMRLDFPDAAAARPARPRSRLGILRGE